MSSGALVIKICQCLQQEPTYVGTCVTNHNLFEVIFSTILVETPTRICWAAQWHEY